MKQHCILCLNFLPSLTVLKMIHAKAKFAFYKGWFPFKVNSGGKGRKCIKLDLLYLFLVISARKNLSARSRSSQSKRLSRIIEILLCYAYVPLYLVRIAFPTLARNTFGKQCTLCVNQVQRNYDGVGVIYAAMKNYI